MADGNTYPALLKDSQEVRVVGNLVFTDSTNQPVTPNPVVSGALSTVQLVTATGAQVSTTRDVSTLTAWTTDGTNNAATAVVALSPDNVTYSTLATISVAAAINNLGALTLPLSLAVPKGWYVKLTLTRVTVSVTSYW